MIRSQRLSGLVVALALATTLVAPAAAPAVAPGATLQAWPGGECPDLKVIFARGSGEAPRESTDRADYGRGSDWGLGSVGAALREKLDRSVAGSGLKIGYEGVVYPALRVPIFDPGTWDDPDLLDTYKQSARDGAAAILDRLEELEASWCPYERTPVVLGGYSQGAWAVRRALNSMTAEQRSAVDGVVLFGDPTKRWQEPIVRWRRLPQAALPEGIAVTFLQAQEPADGLLAPDLHDRSHSYCIPFDIVCGGWDFTALLHGRYPGKAMKAAVADLRPDLPVAPAQLPTAADIDHLYPYLRDGRRDVLHSTGEEDWTPEKCWHWRGIRATTGRWALYETASGDMPYFQGLEDPGVFVYKFRDEATARQAHDTMADFVSRCEGWHDAPDDPGFGWENHEITVPDLGSAAVGYTEYRITPNTITGYTESRSLNLAVLQGRYVVEIANDAEYFTPRKRRGFALARVALAKLG